MSFEEPFAVERDFHNNGEFIFKVIDTRERSIHLHPIAVCSTMEDAESVVYALNKQHRIDNYEYANSKELDEILPLIKKYKDIPESVLVSLIDNVYSSYPKVKLRDNKIIGMNGHVK